MAQVPPDPCEATAGHRGYTILLQEDGRFVHCRGGETTEDEPVSHERVVLQLPPQGPDEPFRYRLFDPTRPLAGRRNPLLLSQLEVIRAYQGALRDLANSPEPLGEALKHLEPAAGAPPASADGQAPAAAESGTPESADALAAEAAQAKYLSYATPAFVDALHVLRRTHRRFERAAENVDDLCRASGARVREGPLRERIVRLCAANPGKRELDSLAGFEASIGGYLEDRAAVRNAVLDLDLMPTSPATQDAAARKATQALATATAAAARLVADAHDLAEKMEDFVDQVRLLRAAVVISASPEGERLTLGRFSANGLFTAPDIFQVRVLKRPSLFLEGEDLGEGGAVEEKPEEQEVLVDRFQPASRNYVEIGLAVMFSSGLPDHPTLAGQLGHQQLVQSRTTGFNGGVLASLEPLEFTTIADPWAELLHFPTIIIPFTVDPTRNYFIGAGVGIFDVASIDVGVHLALTTQPAYATGNYYGETFNTSPIDLDHLTQAGPLAGGWFLSLSVDLVGVVHLIVDQLKPTVRDVHGGATSPQG
ncbi:MAG TPA: hypothetical protein VMB50_22360 [Myxococcales bacterium]|nr:hypothetical protein [Myxococcales bacterium]